MPIPPSGLPRAPKTFGAWVGGRYYSPGTFLPAGTTDYMVYGYKKVETAGNNWRTAGALIIVGSTSQEIFNELAIIFAELERHYQSTGAERFFRAHGE